MKYLLSSKRITVWLVLLFILGIKGLSPANALELALEPPGDREFVRDLAGMLDEKTTKQIKEICDKLLTDKATPIIVVTIDSMAKYGGADMRIETFATILFNQWQIGHAKLGDQDWNTGILLLVSKNDRKARIELGAGWGRREDALCRQIMDDYMIPQFKQGKFSEGILLGVEALDKMARKLELPTKPRSAWSYVIVAVVIGLGIFTVISLIRRGSSGWAWLFWGVVFAVIGTILYQMLSNRGGGGGFSGGSFGGGFSGGGGATGSW
ncbi:TPM domain-containing protein [Gimesia aquarii]|uniref:TPM domain-containing protein n=1 Tax=Gimesia aquarii TaxID=2527964 RepID=A0A517WZC4_9PLAN|nr:TPM domain-containing protein [Gimesia aquarii]QDU10599.1 hypothetical protein V202x_40110 [Gimesia aquarii]